MDEWCCAGGATSNEEPRASCFPGSPKASLSLLSRLRPGTLVPVELRVIKAGRDIRSLTWDEDTLVDWVGGGDRYSLDGAATRACINYAYDFDAAASLASSSWVVIYKRLGTKGLLLNGGQVVRELNRSFYHANVYAYPVALLRTGDGRVVVAHCPDEYNRIEFDDAVTGERLTASKTREPADFFHSRLQPSPDHRLLLSAGWVWHPFDATCWFNVEAALTDPTLLDRFADPAGHVAHVGFVEESSACWQTPTRLLIGGGQDEENPAETAALAGPRITAKGVAVYDIAADRFLYSCSFGHPAGLMMPVGETHVVTFYDHPRLYRIADGKLEREWPEIRSGTETSSIVGYAAERAPPTALDPQRQRFAVANGATIFVVPLEANGIGV